MTIVWDGEDPTGAIEVVDAGRQEAPVGRVCPTDVRECHDSRGGGVVERNPDDHCNFYDCPEVDEETGAVDWDADDYFEEEEEEEEEEGGEEEGEVVAGDVLANEDYDDDDDDANVDAPGELEEEEEKGEEGMMSDLSDAVDEKAEAAAADEAVLMQLNGDEGLLTAVDDNEDGGGGEGSPSSDSSSSSSAASVQSSNRSAWVAHGTVGALVFGLLVPAAISSAFFRERIGERWVFLHVGLNALSLLLLIVGVSLAFVAMNGTIAVEGGRHMDERHHVAGLLLLLLVAFQNANGFLRPPRGSSSPDAGPAVADDDDGDGGGDDDASPVPTVRRLWHSVHVAIGLFVFALGAYQVASGLGLFAGRFGTEDRGPAYLAYILILAAAMLGAKAAGAVRTQFRKKKKAKSEGGSRGMAVFQSPDRGNNLRGAVGRRSSSNASSMVSAKWDEFSVDIDGAA